MLIRWEVLEELLNAKKRITDFSFLGFQVFLMPSSLAHVLPLSPKQSVTPSPFTQPWHFYLHHPSPRFSYTPGTASLLHPLPNTHPISPPPLLSSRAPLHTRIAQLPKAERTNSYNSLVFSPSLTWSRKELFWKDSNAAFTTLGHVLSHFGLKSLQKQAPVKCQTNQSSSTYTWWMINHMRVIQSQLLLLSSVEKALQNACEERY